VSPAGAGDPRLAAARAAAGAVTDPEIPVLTIEDLGILREVSLREGRLEVVLTPTYTGCPAVDVIEADVRAALAAAGWPDARVRTSLSPPWSTDLISERGRRQLLAYGIAPPGPVADHRPDGVGREPGTAPLRLVRREAMASAGPQCPCCSSPRVEKLAEHGSTPCKALYRCLACGEPFDHFKPY
jgi:ring-1,2-phenylacetyl-CoA epoxidase subunit PaaD